MGRFAYFWHARTGSGCFIPTAFLARLNVMAGQETILCVDDEATVLIMQQMLLESAGFRVLTARSGPEAIRVFQSEPVDLVVMDYWMPGMNGTIAASAMKQLKIDVPIIFLSAYNEFPGETVGLASSWVRKGEEEPEEFLARLRALLNERSSERQRKQAS
jgi:two-component system, OmpR family, response regulator RegX3